MHGGYGGSTLCAGSSQHQCDPTAERHSRLCLLHADQPTSITSFAATAPVLIDPENSRSVAITCIAGCSATSSYGTPVMITSPSGPGGVRSVLMSRPASERLFVGLFARTYLGNHTAELHLMFVHVDCGRGSVFPRLRCDVMYFRFRG